MANEYIHAANMTTIKCAIVLDLLTFFTIIIRIHTKCESLAFYGFVTNKNSISVKL